MTLPRRTLIAGLALALTLPLQPRAAIAGTVVKVSLWDKGASAMDGLGTMAPMGLAMAGADMAMATMGITVSPQTIPAGDIQFQVVNESQEFYHMIVVSRILDPSAPLPYLAEMKMVDEATAGIIARGKELKPHTSGTLSATLEPGTYIVYCNIAGHYVMGMWTLITVSP